MGGGGSCSGRTNCRGFCCGTLCHQIRISASLDSSFVGVDDVGNRERTFRAAFIAEKAPVHIKRFRSGHHRVCFPDVASILVVLHSKSSAEVCGVFEAHAPCYFLDAVRC